MHSEERYVSLFRNGRNQAIRIPREFELDSEQAVIRKEGDSLIIKPVKHSSLADLLKNWEPIEESLPDIDNLPELDEPEL